MRDDIAGELLLVIVFTVLAALFVRACIPGDDCSSAIQRCFSSDGIICGDIARRCEDKR